MRSENMNVDFDRFYATVL